MVCCTRIANLVAAGTLVNTRASHPSRRHGNQQHTRNRLHDNRSSTRTSENEPTELALIQAEDTALPTGHAVGTQRTGKLRWSLIFLTRHATGVSHVHL